MPCYVCCTVCMPVGLAAPRTRTWLSSLTRRKPTSSTFPTTSRPCPTRYSTTTFARRALVPGQVQAAQAPAREALARVEALEQVQVQAARALAPGQVPELAALELAPE